MSAQNPSTVLRDHAEMARSDRDRWLDEALSHLERLARVLRGIADANVQIDSDLYAAERLEATVASIPDTKEPTP